MKKVFFIPDFIINNIPSNKDSFLNCLSSFLNELEKDASELRMNNDKDIDIDKMLKENKLNTLSKLDLIRLMSFSFHYSKRIFGDQHSNNVNLYYFNSCVEFLLRNGILPEEEKYFIEILTLYNGNISVDSKDSLEDRSANEINNEYIEPLIINNIIYFIIKPGFGNVCFSNECYAKILTNCMKFDLENRNQYLKILVPVC